MKLTKVAAIALTLGLMQTALAATTVTMTATTKGHKSLGTVTFTDTDYGLLITPNLRGLKPGLHGFHVHSTPSCDQAGAAAGGHLDPKNTGVHLGPFDENGHLGDLPALMVAKNGKATLPTLAPKLTTELLAKHALIIHQGGDNYSDKPEKLGGGGARVACGVVE